MPRLLVLLLYSGAVLGQATVYKTVDEQGVVSFSDTPPADGESAERIEVNAPPPSGGGEYQANLESMRETTDRMAADRRERELHRAEMRELQARTSAYRESGTEGQGSRDYGYVTGYRDWPNTGRYPPGWGHDKPGRPPWRPGHRPEPEHPDARPPLRPVPGGGPSRPTDNNAQLMRPITGRR